ncbi:MAG: hypothetical protein V3T21_02955 [Candidatus Margulisiibacteriota bacterium]
MAKKVKRKAAKRSIRLVAKRGIQKKYSYDAARELKGVISANVHYGLNTMEAVGDRVGEAVQWVFNGAKDLSQNTNALIGNAIARTKKTYKESFDMARKQTRTTLRG